VTSVGAFTPGQLEALSAAIAQGVTTVEHNGKRVRYMSLKQMLELRDRMMSDMENLPPAKARALAHRSVWFNN
jgi:hypothetical protein